MSKYIQLFQNPPKLTVVKDAREVVINVVSCMCDNKHRLTMKKNSDGDFKLGTHGSAYSNFQIKFQKDVVEWEADSANWKTVFEMINSGTSKIEAVRSR